MNQNKFTVVKRDGSLVTILTELNELWLTKRVKQKKDSKRRRKSYKSVFHIPIERIPKHGDWLFTCKMEPVQFDTWDGDDNDFLTLDGSHHSKKHCSLSLISDTYAQFFLQHKLWELYDIHFQNFERYEQAIKQVCDIFKVKYEGY